ncbi:MAG: AAA family ATPase [Nevskia sp.]|nr:AAA family ATPase [Nevskia sp.]
MDSLHNLAKYVPDCLLRSLANEGFRAEPRQQCLDGALLLTDIVGFSSLTEHFAAQGPEGAEHLSGLLEGYFGCMTEIALDHGGDVVDFMGDAIAVMWADSGDLQAGIMRAIQCGLAMQAAAAQLQGNAAWKLEQRVSVAAGRLSLFSVGGAGHRWYWAVAGEPTRLAAAAHDHGRPGDVVVCGDAWRVVQERCRGRPLSARHWIVDEVLQPEACAAAEAVPDSVLRNGGVDAYLGPSLIGRCGESGLPWPGEFRSVATAFIGFPDLNVGSDDAVQQLQAAVECLQYEISRFGGSFERLLMDNKGVTIPAVFGVPMATFGNEPLRAVRTAMAVVEGLRSRGIACSVGVTWGRVFCRDSGGPRRRHLGLVGSSINLAARLMQSSSGSVLCDAAVRDATEHWLEFAERSPLTVKSMTLPVRVFSPGLKLSPSLARFDTPVFGRDMEKGLIDEWIGDLIRCRGGALTIVGEAGIGKSTLLAFAAAHARERGVRVLECAGSMLESATPYFPWRQLLTQLLGGVDPPAMAQTAAGRLANAPRLWACAALLNDILPLGLPGGEATGQMSGEARAASLQALVVHLLRELALERPVLLIADDLHWFDEASATLLAGAAATLPGILMLAGLRVGPHAPANPPLAEFGTMLPLAALSREAMPGFLAHKLGVGEVPEALCDFVHTRTDGNPFFSEEVALALRGSGAIDVEEGRCSLPQGLEAAAAPSAAPISLHAVVLSRVDALPQATQHVLKLASVLGQEFSVESLCEIHPDGQAAEIGPLLDSLHAGQLLRRRADGQPRYTFKHAILQDVVYDLLPFAQRRELHRRLALAIERQAAGRPERVYALLALHWERAAHYPVALDYLEKAARFSFQNYANREAIAHLQHAFQLSLKSGVVVDRLRRSIWCGLLGDAHHELSEYLAAYRYFTRCLDGLGHAPPRFAPAIVSKLLWQSVLQLGLRLGWVKTTALTARSDSGTRIASHVLWKHSEVGYYQNRMLSAICSMLQAMNLAERFGAADGYAYGLAALAQIFALFGWDRLSRYYSRLSLQVSAAQDPPHSQGYVYLVNLLYAVETCDWPAVARFEQQASRIFAGIGASFRWQQTRASVFSVCAMRGQFAEAERVLREARSQLGRDVPWQIRCWMSCTEMTIAMARGLPLTALLENLRKARTPELHVSDKYRSLGLEAQALLQMGRPKAALQVANEALQLMRRGIPMMWSMSDGICAVVQTYSELALLQTDHREARQLQRKARTAARTMLTFARLIRPARPLAALTMGRLESAAGRHGVARRWWKRALRDARRWQMWSDEAQALYELGRTAPESVLREDTLAQARAALEKLGMRPLLNHCEDALCRVQLEREGGKPPQGTWARITEDVS